MREYDIYAKIMPSSGLENISHAQDFLLRKIEKRDLRSFCQENKVSHADLYRMATGERQPGYYMILALRYIIPPMWWFLTIDEKKTTMLKEKASNTEFENSKGFKILKDKSIEKWVEAGYDYHVIYMIKTRKIKNLTFRRIIEFSKKIKPELWFIFED